MTLSIISAKLTRCGSCLIAFVSVCTGEPGGSGMTSSGWEAIVVRLASSDATSRDNFRIPGHGVRRSEAHNNGFPSRKRHYRTSWSACADSRQAHNMRILVFRRVTTSAVWDRVEGLRKQAGAGQRGVALSHVVIGYHYCSLHLRTMRFCEPLSPCTVF